MKLFNSLLSKFKPPIRFQNKTWLVITILAVIALIVTIMAVQPFAPKVITLNPPDKTPDVPLDSPITITFNRAIKPNQQSAIQIILEPSIKGQLSFSSDQTQAIFTPQANYQDNTDYTATITGSDLKESTFSFHTRTIPDTARFPLQLPPPGPANLQDPKQQLLNQLPYYGDHFLIEYTQIRDIFYISIWDQPLEQNQQTALDWLKTQGYSDPLNQLNIQFNIPRNLIPESVNNPNL